MLEEFNLVSSVREGMANVEIARCLNRTPYSVTARLTIINDRLAAEYRHKKPPRVYSLHYGVPSWDTEVHRFMEFEKVIRAIKEKNACLTTASK